MSTARALDEWVGKTADSVIPPRVKARIMERQGNCCSNCGNTFSAYLRPEFDHTVALVNGGQNRESNITALCDLCHAPKTREDVAEKSAVARKRAKHLGLDNRTKARVGGWQADRFKKMPDGRVVDRKTGEEVGGRR